MSSSPLKRCDVRVENITKADWTKKRKKSHEVWKLSQSPVKKFVEMRDGAPFWNEPSSDESDDNMEDLFNKKQQLVKNLEDSHKIMNGNDGDSNDTSISETNAKVVEDSNTITNGHISDANDNTINEAKAKVVPFDQIETLFTDEGDSESDSDLSIRLDNDRVPSPSVQSCTETAKSNEENIDNNDEDEFDPASFMELELEEGLEIDMPDISMSEEDYEEEAITEELLEQLRERVDDVTWIKNSEGEYEVKEENKKWIGLKEDGGYVKIKDEQLFTGKPFNVRMRNIRKVFGLMDRPVLESIIVDNRSEETHPLVCPFFCPEHNVPCEAMFKPKDRQYWLEHVRDGACPYAPSNWKYTELDKDMVQCRVCPEVLHISQVKEHLYSEHFTHGCPGCDEKFDAKMDVEDHIIIEHATHFMSGVKTVWRRPEMREVMIPAPISPLPIPEEREDTPSPPPQPQLPIPRLIAPKSYMKKPNKLVRHIQKVGTPGNVTRPLMMNTGIQQSHMALKTSGPAPLQMRQILVRTPDGMKTMTVQVSGNGQLVGPGNIMGQLAKPNVVGTTPLTIPSHTIRPQSSLMVGQNKILQARSNNIHQARLPVHNQPHTIHSPMIQSLLNPLPRASLPSTQPTIGGRIGPPANVVPPTLLPTIGGRIGGTLDQLHSGVPKPVTSFQSTTGKQLVQMKWPGSNQLVWAEVISSTPMAGTEKVVKQYRMVGPVVSGQQSPAQNGTQSLPSPTIVPNRTPMVLNNISQFVPEGGKKYQLNPRPGVIVTQPEKKITTQNIKQIDKTGEINLTSGFGCKNCSRNFSSKNGLASHVRQAHPFDSLTTENSDQQSGWPRACVFCPMPQRAVYASESRLVYHINTVHPMEFKSGQRGQWNCPSCDKSFNSYLSLGTHRRLGSDVAGGCTGKQSLTGVPLIHCPVIKHPKCQATFEILFDLNKHMRTQHKSSAIFKVLCTQCGSPFQTEGELKKHINTIHNIEHNTSNHGCKECGVSFASKDALQAHKERCHSFPCQFCTSTTFTKQEELDAHTREKHRLDNDGAPILEEDEDSIGVDPLEGLDPLAGLDPMWAEEEGVDPLEENGTNGLTEDNVVIPHQLTV